MDRRFFHIIVLVFLCNLPIAVSAERDDCDFSTRIEGSLSKKFFKRLEIGFKEQLVLDQNSTTVAKVASKADVSYAIVRKFFKIGVSYYGIAKHRDENYFFNQRFQGYTNLKGTLNRFTFAWCSRYQMTYRPEKHPEKQWANYWRNEISATSKVPKIKLYPSVGAEMFFQTNNYKGNVVDNIRYKGALKYEFDKHHSMKLFYYYDDAMNVKSPQDVSTLGIGYHYDF